MVAVRVLRSLTFKCVTVVQTGNAFIVERLAHYDRTLPRDAHVPA